MICLVFKLTGPKVAPMHDRALAILQAEYPPTEWPAVEMEIQFGTYEAKMVSTSMQGDTVVALWEVEVMADVWPYGQAADQ